jgi:hypothetical protein
MKRPPSVCVVFVTPLLYLLRSVGSLLGPLLNTEGAPTRSYHKFAELNFSWKAGKDLGFSTSHPTDALYFCMTFHSEFKCRGYPWFAIGEEATSTLVLLLNLKQLLEDRGFKVYASLDFESEVSFPLRCTFT